MGYTFCLDFVLSLVHTSENQTLPFSSVPSPFYRVCMEFRASVSVSVSVTSVNQALKCFPSDWYDRYSHSDLK